MAHKPLGSIRNLVRGKKRRVRHAAPSDRMPDCFGFSSLGEGAKGRSPDLRLTLRPEVAAPELD